VVFAGQSARFGHPEQTLGITTLLGGIYRVAERVGRARAFEWALTSEQVPAQVMADTSVINRLVPDDELLSHAGDFARRVACGPTLAHAAHKALLHSWTLGGTASADRDLFDLSVPLFATQDVRAGLESAAAALRAGKPRPVLLRCDQRPGDLAGGNGVHRTTVSRWVREVVGLLATRAPRLDRALKKLARKGGGVVLLDGSLIRTRRRTGADNRPNYSGKTKCHGLLVIALTDDRGRLAWISAVRPGRTSEITACGTTSSPPTCGPPGSAPSPTWGSSASTTVLLTPTRQ
jgi:hypothetical protein